jgi:hypothetical protein
VEPITPQKRGFVTSAYRNLRWLTEDFEFADINDAKALLDEL